MLHKIYKKRKSDFGKWLKYFYVLAFLSPVKYGDEFARLMSIVPNI
jgi:hypothetical protein